MKSSPVYCLALSFVIALFLYGCDNEPNTVPDLKDKRTAMEEGHGIESYLSQGGKVKGKLTAPVMLRYHGNNNNDSAYVEFPKTLHVDFFNDSMVKESQLDARYGKYREWENKVFLKDSVVVINVLKHDTLRCEELWWDQNQHKFYTNKPARYSQHDKFVNYGRNGLEAKQDLSDLVFYDNSGTLPVPRDTANAVKDSLITPPAPADSAKKR